MKKIDLKKQLSWHSASAKKVTELEVPTLKFLTIDGTGGPESETHPQTVQALFAVSYTAKFMIKRGLRNGSALGPSTPGQW